MAPGLVGLPAIIQKMLIAGCAPFYESIIPANAVIQTGFLDYGVRWKIDAGHRRPFMLTVICWSWALRWFTQT